MPDKRLLELAEIIDGVIAQGEEYAGGLQGYQADAMFYPQVAVNGTLKMLSAALKARANREMGDG
jgi:hypothetical protein